MRYRMLTCKFCGKECKNSNSLRNHERLCKENPHRQQSPFEKKEIQDNRNKSNQFIKAKSLGVDYEISDETRNKFKELANRVWTVEKRKEQSDWMKIQAQRNLDNYPDSYLHKNIFGRSKKTLYKNEWMHSSWELEFAMWLDSIQVEWTKKVPYFTYDWDGSVRRYFPDFYLKEFDLYVEVKGYQTERDIAKWKCIPNLAIVKEKEIKAIKEKKFELSQLLNGKVP